mmetsp:Transcript_77223/g.236322  ORF Transcript_77223/g.236322 Transcript_77223/m.236322 type:complete len:232 (-) Transcript_77223:1188-1883(-)
MCSSVMPGGMTNVKNHLPPTNANIRGSVSELVARKERVHVSSVFHRSCPKIGYKSSEEKRSPNRASPSATKVWSGLGNTFGAHSSPSRLSRVVVRLVVAVVLTVVVVVGTGHKSTTGVGVRMSDTDPSPSCPATFSPTAHAKPSLRKKRLLRSPAAKATVSSRTCTGEDLLYVVPSPNCRCKLYPAAQAVRSSRKNSECKAPAAMAVTRVAARTGTKRFTSLPSPSWPALL